MQQRAGQSAAASAGDERPVTLGRHGQLVTAARRLPEERIPRDPGRLLAALDAPRGAWERDGAWSVHGGSARTLEPARDAGDRFASIRDRGVALAGASAGEGGAGTVDRRRAAPAPRLYGGFSFHPSPDLTGSWSAFPDARFRAPAREVRVEDGRAWALASRPAGDDPEEAAGRAGRDLARLEEIAARVAAGDGPAADGRVRVPEALDVTAGSLADAGPERERWERSVEEALAGIRTGRLEKVVLARTLDLSADSAADPARTFRRLRADNPDSSLFFLQPEPGTAFLGASPELLGSARGRVFRATAVAGSVPRGGSESEDRDLGRRLMDSEKDRREQAIVAEEIRRCLARRLRAVSVGEPRLLKLARIQHLESAVEGRFPVGADAPRPHLLDLVAELHPTPAVCGRPREEALRLLRRTEPFERGWYAGPIGWFGPSGRGEFVPGLRSAVLHGGAWRLFAGAGIVAGSEPMREWDETGFKFTPMLRALGVGDGA